VTGSPTALQDRGLVAEVATSPIPAILGFFATAKRRMEADDAC
jgi:hypothetical protein